MHVMMGWMHAPHVRTAGGVVVPHQVSYSCIPQLLLEPCTFEAIHRSLPFHPSCPPCIIPWHLESISRSHHSMPSKVLQYASATSACSLQNYIAEAPVYARPASTDQQGPGLTTLPSCPAAEHKYQACCCE